MDGDRGSPDVQELLGSLEARVMEDLWVHGASPVGEVLSRLNGSTRRQLAYNTVMTVMTKLGDKGYLNRQRTGRPYVYEPVHNRDRFIRSRAAAAASDLLEDFNELAVAGFVDSVRSRPSLLRELERMLDEENHGEASEEDHGEASPERT